MNVLIGQPVHEKGITQLKNEIKLNEGKKIDIILYPEGYLSNEEVLEDACKIAKESKVMIITSYRTDNKDRAVIISDTGDMILERAKTPPDEKEVLNKPFCINSNGTKIGYLLCMEILKGMRDFKETGTNIKFIAHPIGVGMFSDEQFEQWIAEAKKIAKKYKTIILGTSHADGSYKNCGISIPISYCIDSNGHPIYISKSNVKSYVINLDTKEFEIL